jgi:transcriptional regulator GlxA family with amidase domain
MRSGKQGKTRPDGTTPAGNLDMSIRPPHRLYLLASPETSPLVLYGLLDVLSTVGALYSELTSGSPGVPLFDVKITAATSEPFRCHGRVVVEPDAAVDDVDAADIVIVCDMYQPIDRPPHGLYPAETAWLRRMYASDALVASVCSGSLVLAEAGLLDGHEAAGHWCYAPMVREHYPSVRLREDLVLCRSGPDERIVTTGAVTAWQDLALYLINRFGGPDHAIRTAKIYLFAEHADGQLPYAVTTPRLQTRDSAVRQSQIWIAENYASTNPVGQMSEVAGLTRRSFARRFRAATGLTAMDYVHAIRVDEAKQLLETGALGTEEVGHAVGYEDPASFVRMFKRRAGLTPAAYRRKFAGLVGAVD